MSNRIDYAKASPAGYKAFGGVYVHLQNSGLEKELVNLVSRSRLADQIGGGALATEDSKCNDNYSPMDGCELGHQTRIQVRSTEYFADRASAATPTTIAAPRLKPARTMF